MYLEDVNIERELTLAFKEYLKQQTISLDTLTELVLQRRFIPEIHQKMVSLLDKTLTADLEKIKAEGFHLFIEDRIHVRYGALLKKARLLNYPVFLRHLATYLASNMNINYQVQDLITLTDGMLEVEQQDAKYKSLQVMKETVIQEQQSLIKSLLSLNRAQLLSSNAAYSLLKENRKVVKNLKKHHSERLLYVWVATAGRGGWSLWIGIPAAIFATLFILPLVTLELPIFLILILAAFATLSIAGVVGAVAFFFEPNIEECYHKVAHAKHFKELKKLDLELSDLEGLTRASVSKEIEQLGQSITELNNRQQEIKDKGEQLLTEVKAKVPPSVAANHASFFNNPQSEPEVPSAIRQEP